jgi:hypothetical protein
MVIFVGLKKSHIKVMFMKTITTLYTKQSNRRQENRKHITEQLGKQLLATDEVKSLII